MVFSVDGLGVGMNGSQRGLVLRKRKKRHHLDVRGYVLRARLHYQHREGDVSPTEAPVTMLSVAVGDHLRFRAGKTRAADTRRGVVVVGRCYRRVWVCKDLARTNVTALWVRHSRLQLSRPHPSTLRMALRGLLLCCASVQQRRACGY